VVGQGAIYGTGYNRGLSVSPSPDAERSRPNTLLNLALAGLGAILLVVTVRRVGWSTVQGSVTSVGWWLVPVVFLGLIRFAARARSWQTCAGHGSLPFGVALSATLAADALGNVTPLGLLASEPAKVFFVKGRLSTIEAVASVAAENAFYVASVLLMIGAGAIVFFERASLSETLQLAAQGVLVAVMAGAMIGVWIARRQPAILSRLARTVARWTGRGETAPDRLRELEVHFYAILRWPASRIARAFFWEAVFHAAAVTEVFMVLRVLPSARPITLLDAFVLETAGRLIVVAFKFVPYRLGVDEAGTALVARALALDPALGVALALVRRVRILILNAVGLAWLATSRRGRD
jgi:hypothetical protein